MQRTLARLYTDGLFRERFFANPAATGEELGLTPDEAKQLGGSRASISAFARSLQIKRLGEAGHLLPATRRALGARYGALFLEYAAAPPPAGRHKVSQDAFRFLCFLVSRHQASLEPWIVDLARFEAAWILAGFPTVRIVARLFRWPVHRLARGEAASTKKPERYLGIWFRLTPRHRLRHYWLRLP